MSRTTSVRRATGASVPSPLAYSLSDAARTIGIGSTKLNELIRSGDLATFTVGRRRLVRAEDLVAFICQRRRAASRRL
ncbi:MAG: helix-turn-helix domain-containing protein [Planctomycetes bacterium]|nr:helix-turn-helix domain-containing protein [Planctomycetota bacterium]